MKLEVNLVCALVAMWTISCQSDRKDANEVVSRDHGKVIRTKEYKTARIEHEGTKMRMEIPTNWTTSVLSKDATSFKENGDSSSKFRSNAVLKFTARNKYSLKQISESVLASVERDYLKARIISRSTGTISGDSVAILDCIVYTHSTNLGTSIMLLIHNDEVISLDYIALNEPEGEYASNRNVFQKMYETLIVEN
ncbi:hypothetical protein ACFQ48_14030 [Hymenobacter caeli]|uniref:DUF1795 domain-containing protein n=1 Tax=Hymenobacter caeli TaxID=2735894 RepID=A0ABX2FTZ9_9BACT|nr:hypothetical protein [Hymenobacter caeli]NRT20486.1 hypothetical protein [Hymenobacter caeli]